MAAVSLIFKAVYGISMGAKSKLQYLTDFMYALLVFLCLRLAVLTVASPVTEREA